MKYLKLFELFLDGNKIGDKIGDKFEDTFFNKIYREFIGKSLKIKYKYYTAKDKFTETWDMFKIGEITYHYDPFNNFHTFNLYRDNSETNDYIDIVIDPKNPNHPKKLFLRFDNKWKFDILEWENVLDDFISKVNDYYLKNK